MTAIVDLFGFDTGAVLQPDWATVVAKQQCRFVSKKCYKTRKSQSEIAIGTCSVSYNNSPVMICPLRLLERRQIFVDCLHLLTGHEPGNELHIVSEIAVPGGSIDYMLASIRGGKVRDFVAIELQTLDTTGTVWPERQRFVASKGILVDPNDLINRRSFGMNWKMTAKTILVQLHHKIQTIETLNKHLVLVIQDRLLNYMSREFSLEHLVPARISDSLHFHAYGLVLGLGGGHVLDMAARLSTDRAGVERALGRQSEANVDLQVIANAIERRITDATRFDFSQPLPAIRVDPED